MAPRGDAGYAMGDALRESDAGARVIVEHRPPPRSVIALQRKYVAAPWLLFAFALGVVACIFVRWLYARRIRKAKRRSA